MTARTHDFHDGSRQLQDKFDTRRLADRSAKRVTETIGEADREFIGRADMFFLATCDHRGIPTVSFKGGDPGFVRVVDERSIAFPNYDGNGKYLSMGNLLMNPNVGLLFIDFENQKRMRLQGVATIRDDDELLAEYPEAQFVVRVEATEVFTNCPRYVPKYQLLERSKFVPRAGHETPVPEWKTNPEVQDLLPAKDPARKLDRA
jgi:predicted pyridoxine 5'-phosphate oxidase superfamily flavin-nucleotide-binding protein